MKHCTKLFALLLVCAMFFSLAACSTTEGEGAGDAENSDAPALPSDFVADPNVEDLWLATTGIPGDFELLTADGVPVTARSYFYCLAQSISTYYGTEIDWTAETESGEPLTEEMKGDALDAAVLYALVVARAKELGYEMTQEQTEELESSLALTTFSFGGEEAFADALRQAGLDYDTFYALNASSYYYLQLADGLFAGRPTDEEMAEYIEENDILYAKHILLMTVDAETREPLDEATIAEKKATAENLLAQLRSSEDPLTEFDTLMNQYSEDTGLLYNPDGYTFTAGDMVPEFENATRALEYGQISDLVESDFGYHIILRLDPATEDLRLQRHYTLMDEQLVTWANEADLVFTDEYNSLNVQLFYEKFLAYQDAFAAAAEEAAANADDAEPTGNPEGTDNAEGADNANPTDNPGDAENAQDSQQED